MQFIAGAWRPGGSGRELTVLNPSDDTPVTRMIVSDETDVAAAVAAARDAAPGPRRCTRRQTRSRQAPASWPG